MKEKRMPFRTVHAKCYDRCPIEGCRKLQWAKGLCRKHYDQQRFMNRHMKATTPPPETMTTPTKLDSELEEIKARYEITPLEGYLPSSMSEDIRRLLSIVKELQKENEELRQQFLRIEVSNGIYGVNPVTTVDLLLSRFKEVHDNSEIENRVLKDRLQTESRITNESIAYQMELKAEKRALEERLALVDGDEMRKMDYEHELKQSKKIDELEERLAKAEAVVDLARKVNDDENGAYHPKSMDAAYYFHKLIAAFKAYDSARSETHQGKEEE